MNIHQGDTTDLEAVQAFSETGGEKYGTNVSN